MAEWGLEQISQDNASCTGQKFYTKKLKIQESLNMIIDIDENLSSILTSHEPKTCLLTCSFNYQIFKYTLLVIFALAGRSVRRKTKYVTTRLGKTCCFTHNFLNSVENVFGNVSSIVIVIY